MKILFLVPYPLDEAPSQRFRFEQYFAAMDREGICYEVHPFLDLDTWQVLYKEGNTVKKSLGMIRGGVRRLSVLARLQRFDKVFIHREAAPVGPPLIEWLVAKVFQKSIVYDFDDAIWLPNTTKANAVAAVVKWHTKVKTICKWSQRVSVGNHYLRDYASQFCHDVRLNPTTVDTENRHKPGNRSNKKTVIGWTGTHSTGKYLEPLVSVLRQLAEEYAFTFLYISNAPPEFDLPNLQYLSWGKTQEVADLNRMDIGVMPLVDDEWAKGKCGFKALQYMALEIPAVVSPVGVNAHIVEDGINGFLCTTPEEWKLKLKILLEDSRLREYMGKQGRQKVIDQYSVQANTANFLQILRD